MAQPDWTDALLSRLAATRSTREIEPFEVTARISRLSLHIARIQEESFGRFGLNRGDDAAGCNVADSNDDPVQHNERNAG